MFTISTVPFEFAPIVALWLIITVYNIMSCGAILIIIRRHNFCRFLRVNFCNSAIDSECDAELKNNNGKERASVYNYKGSIPLMAHRAERDGHRVDLVFLKPAKMHRGQLC